MTTKQALLKAIEQLSEQQLIEVLQYVQHLSHVQKSMPTELNQVVDPLAEFIGAVSHGSLAANLDDELYGRLRSSLILGAGLLFTTKANATTGKLLRFINK